MRLFSLLQYSLLTLWLLLLLQFLRRSSSKQKISVTFGAERLGTPAGSLLCLAQGARRIPASF